MRKSILSSLLILISFFAISQTAANTWSVKFSNAIISRYQPTINKMTSKGWEYSNSIILHGIEKAYNNVQDVAYLNYIKAYVDTYVAADGSVSGLSQSLDKIHPGILCLFLYEKTGLLKYKTAAQKIRNYLLAGSPAYPKTPTGGYWHKNTTDYKNVMMADGMYMAHVFLAKYGKMFNDQACFDTATSQILLLASHIYDPTTNLVKHAWNYDRTTYTWSNTTTGVSSEVWSRGMGWFVMAIVDVLRYLPSSHSKYTQLRTLLSNLAIGIKNNQNAATGLWYQVVNKGSSAGNYLETSGSAMFVYSIKVAVDSGWINSSYLPVARSGWTGLQTKISTYTDGKPQINQFAPAMSVQKNYSAYVSIAPVNCPTASGTQNPHGYAAILMAASVMEFPLQTARIANSIIPGEANDDSKPGLVAYPNPAHTLLSLHYKADKDQNTVLQLYDITGKAILSRQFNVSKGTNILQWNISSVPQGVYFINEKNKTGTSALKIVKY